MGIEIKEAILENFKDILNFNKQLFCYEYENFNKTLNCDWPSNNEEYFKESIEDENSLALVVFVDGKLAGYLIGSIKDSEDYRNIRNIKKLAELDNMFLLPEFRGKGIGDSLCKSFLKWAKKEGVKRVKVVASAQNKNAIACYRKVGFSDYNLTLEMDL